jgi:uncharacterized Zn-binding protein involved in type VI secretion
MSHFGEALTRARELAKARQKTNPNDGEALFALTLAAGMESDAESILQKKHMDGLKRMKEANKYADRLLAQDPDATDAYIALGIANYIIGSQSSGARFALWFDGVHGNRQLGMEQVAKLRSTATTATLRKNHPCPCRPPRKTGSPRTKVVTGTVRAVSGHSTVCCGVCQGIEPAAAGGLGSLTSLCVFH